VPESKPVCWCSLVRAPHQGRHQEFCKSQNLNGLRGFESHQLLAQCPSPNRPSELQILSVAGPRLEPALNNL